MYNAMYTSWKQSTLFLYEVKLSFYVQKFFSAVKISYD